MFLWSVIWKTIRRLFRRPSNMERARVAFEKATAEIATEKRFGGPDRHSTEIEIMEEATALTKAAVKHRKKVP